MRRFSLSLGAALVAIAGAASAQSTGSDLPAGSSAQVMVAEDPIAAAIADPSRAVDNVKLDDGRKPAEVLRFLGLKPGMNVIDMFGANRYWAEIIAPVVGPYGSVLVWQPSQFINAKLHGEFAEFTRRQPNAVLLSSRFEQPLIGADRYDFMIMNLDYHDVYWESEERKITRMEPQLWLKRLYDAMKPGAVVGIIDHSALPGSDVRTTVDTLHRIDADVVKADFQRAGFVLEAESDLLRNPGDDRKVSVFDPAIRGKTDRFVFRFRKPA